MSPGNQTSVRWKIRQCSYLLSLLSHSNTWLLNGHTGYCYWPPDPRDLNGGGSLDLHLYIYVLLSTASPNTPDSLQELLLFLTPNYASHSLQTTEISLYRCLSLKTTILLFSSSLCFPQPCPPQKPFLIISLILGYVLKHFHNVPDYGIIIKIHEPPSSVYYGYLGLSSGVGGPSNLVSFYNLWTSCTNLA